MPHSRRAGQWPTLPLRRWRKAGFRLTRHFLPGARDFGRAGNGQHDRASLEKPGKGDLARSGVVGLGYSIDRAAIREAARGDWSPGDETDAVALAIVEHVFAAAIDKVVAILNSHDVEHLGGGFDLNDR